MKFKIGDRVRDVCSRYINVNLGTIVGTKFGSNRSLMYEINFDAVRHDKLACFEHEIELVEENRPCRNLQDSPDRYSHQEKHSNTDDELGFGYKENNVGHYDEQRERQIRRAPKEGNIPVGMIQRSAESVLELTSKEAHDPVNHPKHYNSHPSGIQCIQITEHMGFCLGNAIKYLFRADLKNGIEDLKKAIWYINREIEKREKENNNV